MRSAQSHERSDRPFCNRGRGGKRSACSENINLHSPRLVSRNDVKMPQELKASIRSRPRTPTTIARRPKILSDIPRRHVCVSLLLLLLPKRLRPATEAVVRNSHPAWPPRRFRRRQLGPTRRNKSNRDLRAETAGTTRHRASRRALRRHTASWHATTAAGPHVLHNSRSSSRARPATATPAGHAPAARMVRSATREGGGGAQKRRQRCRA